MELPKKYKAGEIEATWTKAWEDSRIYAWDPTASREDTFVVDTPPPTVSGSLHVGHMFSYSHQDFIVRYQRMRGKNIYFPIGWDDNGLPTERRVQNLYNVKCETHLHYEPRNRSAGRTSSSFVRLRRRKTSRHLSTFGRGSGCRMTGTKSTRRSTSIAGGFRS